LKSCGNENLPSAGRQILFHKGDQELEIVYSNPTRPTSA